MWSMLFSISLCGVIATAMSENSGIWFLFFSIATYICVAGVVITHEKQKEKIENLEKKLEELVGEDSE